LEAVSFAREIFFNVTYGACVFRVIDAADRSVERENEKISQIRLRRNATRLLHYNRRDLTKSPKPRNNIPPKGLL